MAETQMTWRSTLMVLLLLTVTFSGTVTVGMRQVFALPGVITLLATTWLLWLTINAMRDRRRGIQRSAVKVSGWLHVWFGCIVALGGILCSALAYESVASEGGGM